MEGGPIPVPQSIGGPAIVMAIVLAETAVGGLAVLWLSPVWGRVRMGFFKLVGAVLTASALFSWLAARDPLGAGSASTGARAWLLAFAAVCGVWQVALWARGGETSRWIGIAATPVGVVALVMLGVHPDVNVVEPAAIFQLLAGALFLGGATLGLLLGHWHLVDRKLGREPIARINFLYLVGCGVAAIAALLGGGGGGEARADLSPLLGVGVLTTSIAVGLAALCAMIGFFNRALIKENSIQSATGLFYLGVILAFAAEFAAKVRFF